ncbi:non-lysosomal glucosylceramidase [bacterium]|nr:non-lysosomal glucosylceramidase [bacterium]
MSSIKLNENWPVLKNYDSNHLRRIAMPLGGIGTGTISIGGRGDLRDWEILNKPAKGFLPPSLFVLYAKQGDNAPVSRMLEGLIDHADYEGPNGCSIPYHGLPKFKEARFHAAYPLAQVTLSDDNVPLDVRLEAFNPLVACDSQASGWPVAVLRYSLTNKTNQTVQASICGDIPNFVDAGGTNTAVIRESGELKGVFLACDGGDAGAEKWGTLALACTEPDVTFRTAWLPTFWAGDLLDFWDDFSTDGRISELPPEKRDRPRASVCASVEVPAGESRNITFLITWHFPNRMTWTPAPKEDCGCSGGCCSSNSDRVGNYYTTIFADAWDVAEKFAPQLDSLEARTIEFVSSFCNSNLPDVVKEAALFNLSTLRSETCFRTEDGRFYGWEGCQDTAGCCHGTCTHVWNYEQATAFLFGDLNRSMRETEFLLATHSDGFMPFRVNQPLDRAAEFAGAAADGQMGCLMKLYRDWQLSGDDNMLRTLWPKARRSMEFCWIPKGWDSDKDGVMEGCQHNTMDVEYFGPNPQMGGWYLGALRACEEMANYLGEHDFAAECRELFEKGSKWLDANLFNGEYYEHQVRPPMSKDNIAEHLLVGMGTSNFEEPDLQLGAGCLVDQLVGQYMSHICGLGYLLDADKVKTTLQSILKYNFRKLEGHFNHPRSFVMSDESAVLMSTYPRGRRPRLPFPYANEVMTGFEYTAAAHMLYEGQVADGLRIIEAIRERYDGQRRSPFDEAECGHHYARAMASWAAVLALTGFHYSGVDKSIEFAERDGVNFWSTGFAWGTCEQSRIDNGVKVILRVTHGALVLKSLTITGVGTISEDHAITLSGGDVFEYVIKGKK